MTRREELADGRAARPAKGAKGAAAQKGPCRSAEGGAMQSPEARPGAAKPPDGAQRGATCPKRTRDKRTGCAFWRAVPLPFRREGKTKAKLGRPRAARTMEFAPHETIKTRVAFSPPHPEEAAQRSSRRMGGPPISGLTEIGILMCASRVNPTCDVRDARVPRAPHHEAAKITAKRLELARMNDQQDRLRLQEKIRRTQHKMVDAL